MYLFESFECEAENDWDIKMTVDFLHGTLYGGQIRIHRGDLDIDTVGPLVSPTAFSGFISTCKSGTDADVSTLGASLWPVWWAAQVVARGLVSDVRQAGKALALIQW
jgi:hypothetical protein